MDEDFGEKIWWLNRLAQRYNYWFRWFISLANHWWFAIFAKLSCYTVNIWSWWYNYCYCATMMSWSKMTISVRSLCYHIWYWIIVCHKFSKSWQFFNYLHLTKFHDQLVIQRLIGGIHVKIIINIGKEWLL